MRTWVSPSCNHITTSWEHRGETGFSPKCLPVSTQWTSLDHLGSHLPQGSRLPSPSSLGWGRKSCEYSQPWQKGAGPLLPASAEAAPNPAAPGRCLLALLLVFGAQTLPLHVDMLLPPAPSHAWGLLKELQTGLTSGPPAWEWLVVITAPTVWVYVCWDREPQAHRVTTMLGTV